MSQLVWNIVRVILVALAAVTLLVTPLVEDGPGGVAIIPIGLVVDLAAVAVIVWAVAGWIRAPRARSSSGG